MTLRSALLIGAVITAAVVSYVGFRAGTRAGEFTTLVPVFDGTCQPVLTGMPGAEDIVLDRASGTLFVSSDDRRAWGAATPVRGAIYAVPLREAAIVSQRADMTGAVPPVFHPHGLSLWTGPDGARVLMVVNHTQRANPAGTTVEIFDVADNNSLSLRRTVAVPGLTRINDIAATGPDSFYATSESKLASGSLSEFAAILLADGGTSGSVWYFDGTAGREVAGGIGFANSPALSPDGGRLYVSGTLDRTLHIFTRDVATGGLTPLEKVFIGSGLDNLDVEPDGRIWIGTHPKLFTWLGHARDARRVAPSQVLVVEPAASGSGGMVDQVLLQEGSAEFSGATVAVRDGESLVMGSVFDRGIRICQLPPIWKQSQSHPANRLIDPARDAVAKASGQR